MVSNSVLSCLPPKASLVMYNGWKVPFGSVPNPVSTTNVYSFPGINENVKTKLPTSVANQIPILVI